jgi:rhamnosyltransferase
MPENKVCAVVVTFHPGATDIQNLGKLRSQVETLVVVDNGSTEDQLEALRIAGQSLDAVLLENSANLGIAAALNIGVRWAIAHQHEWVALFDQDSTVTDGFIESMLDGMKALPGSSTVMQIIPRYRDLVSGNEEVIGLHSDGGPFITRTSGSFFPIRVFEKCGLFTEELFIYCVDDDFSLRLRSMGFSIAQSKTAVLLHSAGKPSRVSILGKSFTTRNYRPEIQYYWARNRVWLLRKHGRRYPHLIYWSLRSLVGVPLKIALGEKMPGRKIGMFARGILDGLLGKTGRRVSVC